MRRSTSLVCIRAAAFSLPAIIIACGSSTPQGFDSNPSGSNSSHSTSNSTGSHSNSTGTTVVTGTTTSVSTSTLADGGITSTTVTVTTSSTVTTTQSNSSTSASGGADGGATGDGGTARTCTVAGTNVIADFEDGKISDVAANNFTGTWGTFASQSTPGQPVLATSDEPTTSPFPSCNTKVLHATLTTAVTTPTTNYGQTKNDLQTHGATAAIPNVALTGDGISFDIKTGPGKTTFPITFELADAESQPATNNGNPWGGTATTAGVDQFNNRGWLLSDSAADLKYNGAVISSTWTRVYVPFSEMPPHFLPSGCPAGGPCQAPNIDPSKAMTLQFALNPDQNASGTFDIFVDNVQTYTGTQGLTPPDMPNGITATFADGALSGCTKPTGSNVGGKYLQWAYRNWYKHFVVADGANLRVQRPENNNNTVSEGIGYGMLIAVAVGDKTLFDGLFNYWQQHGSGAGKLMVWITDGSSQGSATDADQDAAFALLQADKKWPGNTYGTYASALISDIWTNEIDQTSHLPTGGSNYGKSTSTNLTNPSYFAPGYYPTFAKADTGHNWAQVATAVYGSLNSLLSSNKLPSAWCQNNCTQEVANNNTGAQNGTLQYQYDAHRVPWRVGLDKCWGTATASMATPVLSKIVGVFSAIASTNQIGRLVDLYNPDGTAVSTGVPNSMSLIGTAAVGGMGASSAAFVNSAWQFLLDGENRSALDVSSTPSQSGYSYFNATVGLLSLLSLSGNIQPPM